MTLSDWDTRLLKLYLTRYKRLAAGLSKPNSNKEKAKPVQRYPYQEK